MLEFFSNLWKSDTPRKHVLGFYETMKPYHEANCKKWYANLSMIYGNQWATYLNGNNLSVPAAPSWRLHLTYNKLLPLSVMQRHKLMPDNPTINVRPANMESDIDKQNANTAKQLLKAKWKEEDFQEELEEMTRWMVPCTIGYMLTLWDGRAGTEIAPGVGTGDQMFEAPSPFEIIPDYTVSRFKYMHRFLRIKVRSLEYIQYRYNKKVKPQKLDTNSIFQLKAQALATGAQIDITKAFEDHALVYDMWEMPSAKYPMGFHHICTEDCDLTAPGEEKDVLAPEALDPYYYLSNGNQKDYFLPLDAAQMIQLPGMLIGTNCVEQASAAQCVYNKGNSTIQENANRLGRTKILAPVGKIPQGAMVEDPAQIITEYNADEDGEIIILRPPEMAQYHLNFIGKQPAEMQDSFGIHEATQGVLPRRATSGKAIGFLVGQDDERHLDPKADVDKVIGHAFEKALNLMANGYTEERVKDLIGDDGVILTRKLKGEELRAVDVTITRDTAMPKSAADRMDLAMEILDKKATKEQMAIVFKIMTAQSIEDIQAILSGNTEAEEIYARMENFDMMKLIPRHPVQGENHQMHIKTHEELMRNPNASQDTKFLSQAHIQEHQQQEGLEAAQGQATAAAAAGQLPVEGGQPGGEALPPMPAAPVGPAGVGPVVYK